MDHARGSRRWGVVRVVWFAVAASAGAQQPGGADAPAALVAEIARRFRCIESCARTLAIRVEVEVREHGGATFDPPKSAQVDWRMRGGRTLVRVAGCDLDSVADEEQPPQAVRSRLYLPGGITESTDAAGSFTREQRSYLDAGSLTSDLGPSEFLWTFCGTYRSVILAERATRVVGVTGATPDRIVDLEADDRTGTQRITFSCVESWGFLPRACRMFARHRGRWEELRTIEVGAARATRLGFAPERASLTARIPRSGAAPAPESFQVRRASYRFGPPEFTGISVPHSLAESERGASRPSGFGASSRESMTDPDPIFSAQSVLFREPISSRAADLDAWVRPVEALRAPRGAGAMRTGSWAWSAVAGGIASIGIVGIVRRRRRVVLAAIVGCMAVLATAAAVAGVGSATGPGDAGDRLSRLDPVASSVPPPSKVLCGADCLYVAAAWSSESRPDYAQVVKLVRPGAQGSTLEALRIAAECLGQESVIVDPRSFDAPPGVMLGHLEPRHFVVVTVLEDGRVAIVDPGRGLFRAPWNEVRGLFSRAALAFRRGGQP